MPLFYYACVTVMKVLLLTFGQWQVRAVGRIPPTGPLIVASNHLNLADPPLLCASIPRRIVFMTKEELVYSRRGGHFIRAFGAVPVRREGLDRKALRQAQALLDRGMALGMFPEGTRSPSAQMQRAYPGTALLALRSGAPILPVGITGTENIKGMGRVLARPRIRITVTMGEPFHLPPLQGRASAARLAELTDLIMARIARLLPSSYRGVYGEAVLNEGIIGAMGHEAKPHLWPRCHG